MIIVDQNVSGGSVQHQWKVGAKGICKKTHLQKTYWIAKSRQTDLMYSSELLGIWLTTTWSRFALNSLSNTDCVIRAV